MTIIGVGGGGAGGAAAPPGVGNLLKFGQMAWDIRAFGGTKKIYNFKNNKNKNKNNDKRVLVTR